MSTIDKTYAYPHLWRMGKFLTTTLFGLALLVNPAFAEEFALTTSYYSAWQNTGTQFEIISNPEDDWAYWSNDNLNQNVRCNVVTRKKYTAVYNCEDQRVLRLRYDKQSGALYINDFRFDRFK